MKIPFHELETIFLDAGNTLFGMDHTLMSRELEVLGIRCAADTLARAEAAARPLVSRRVADGGSTESDDLFSFYMYKLLEGALALPSADLERLTPRWVQALRAPEVRDTLWTRVAPGTAVLLATLRSAGLRLVVVSNSDGTIEAALEAAGLREDLYAVIDSEVVGYEKPDPRIFRKALELAAAAPARTLHIGDLYAVDVCGARSVGIHALLLDPYGDWIEVDCPVAPDLAAAVQTIVTARAQRRT